MYLDGLLIYLNDKQLIKVSIVEIPKNSGLRLNRNFHQYRNLGLNQ